MGKDGKELPGGQGPGWRQLGRQQTGGGGLGRRPSFPWQGRVGEDPVRDKDGVDKDRVGDNWVHEKDGVDKDHVCDEEWIDDD